MGIIIDAMVSVQPRVVDIAADVISVLQTGVSAKVTVEPYDETKEKKSAAKARSLAQNRLIYKAYQRIGKTLYGGDESHARNECKLRIGCRILYRDSEEFARVFDTVIRPLSHENKLAAMTLISVSSIMEIPQATEYIKTIFTEYGQRGVYFLDLEGASDYLEYPEAAK
jgi:hypothetical protein